MARYIYEELNWPNFYWKKDEITAPLNEVKILQAKLLGKMSALGFDIQQESSNRIIENEIVKTNEIEGAIFDSQQVRSSICKKLGLENQLPKNDNKNIDGFVDLIFDATQNHNQVITSERLFDWHSALFQTGRNGLYKIAVAQWRKLENEPMQVVSGSIGKEKIHFEAPNSEKLSYEMSVFLDYLNNDSSQDLILKTAILHLWFLTLHPFEDGNGRIARIISEYFLTKSDNSNLRFYSLSTQIAKDKKNYYLMLEQSQKGSLDITNWLVWFLETLQKTLIQSEEIIAKTLAKATFWQQHSRTLLNSRQTKMLNLILDSFEGNLTTKKWAQINKCSDDSALRDINDLIAKRILYKDEKGSRSTNYIMKF
jgi:Fic family protein